VSTFAEQDRVFARLCVCGLRNTTGRAYRSRGKRERVRLLFWSPARNVLKIYKRPNGRSGTFNDGVLNARAVYRRILDPGVKRSYSLVVSTVVRRPVAVRVRQTARETERDAKVSPTVQAWENVPGRTYRYRSDSCRPHYRQFGSALGDTNYYCYLIRLDACTTAA